MHSIQRAILLVAGRGWRLNDLNHLHPKCLLEVGGMPILLRSLQILKDCGFTEFILVVGYKSSQIWQFINQYFPSLNVSYVLNARFAETNTAYSLWLARDYLNTDCLLLEGDILFEAAVIRRILSILERVSVWAAKPLTEVECEGILLARSEDCFVSDLEFVRKSENKPPHLEYKCAGIQLLTKDLALAFAATLDSTKKGGQEHKYADLVLGTLLEEYPISLCSLDGLLWAEVDTQEDFMKANHLFTQNDRSQSNPILR